MIWLVIITNFYNLFAIVSLFNAYWVSGSGVKLDPLGILKCFDVNLYCVQYKTYKQSILSKNHICNICPRRCIEPEDLNVHLMREKYRPCRSCRSDLFPLKSSSKYLLDGWTCIVSLKQDGMQCLTRAAGVHNAMLASLSSASFSSHYLVKTPLAAY